MKREKAFKVPQRPAEDSRRAVQILLLTLICFAAMVAPGGAQSPLQWSVCPGLPGTGQECATLRVPLDYRAPAGRTIDIAISRVKSTAPGARRGVLLLNPGGPGGPGLDLPRMFSALLPQSVLDAYDLIGFDPRFVGTSTPVSCGLTEREGDQAFFPLEQPGGFPATVAFVREIADRCAGEAGDVLRFATTANTARDMDQIRQALGEEKISYLGYSYGTYLGAVYAALFPGRTDRFVLDSSVGNKWVWRQQARSAGPGGELRFPDFANFAAANDARYHLGDTPAEIRTLYFELLDRLGENPLTAPDGTVVTGPLFRALTFRGLYFDGDFPDLALIWQFVNEAGGKAAASPELLAAVEALKPAAAAVEVPEDNGTASGLAIVCDDVAWPRSVKTYQQDFLSDSRRYPMFGALGSNIWPCAFWHARPVERLVPITSKGPRNILMVQNLRDPATPFEGALQMRNALGQRARFVSVDQGGHTVYLLTPNTCGNAIVTAYLAEGILPGSDQSCPADPPAAAPQSVDTLRAQAIEELARRVRGVIP